MTERIEKLAKLTISGEMWLGCVKTEYDREDVFLSPIQMSAKRVCEYILNQDFLIKEESCFTGLLTFDGTVEGNIFNRMGHKNFSLLTENFYNKPVRNLLTFEWQHSVGNFEKIIRRGIRGIKEDIGKSKTAHRGDKEALEFLATQEMFCDAVIARAKIGVKKVSEKSSDTSNPHYKSNLQKLSEALKKVPEHPAETFYEAVLSLFFCYGYIPDSIGLIDRYLYPYYKHDREKGILTLQEAKEYLQELFLMLQSRIHISSNRFYRGGESHFCVGGYLENGEDGFNELSRLIVDSLMELPTWIPQISLRWTKKTPRDVLRFMMDCERNDPNKRIAFVNDEPRIKGLMEHTGLSYSEAVSYTMMGCNELALPGGMVFGFDPLNIVRSVENTFHNRTEDIINAKNFDEFFDIYKEELFSDLWEAERISKGFQDARSRDCNIVSNIFLEGCIERAKSCTQGGLSRYIAVGLPIGISNVVDSLSVAKQFVYDDKIITMKELVDALKSNWKGFEDLKNLILKKGDFFGNDTPRSNEISQRFTNALDEWNNTENYLGKKWIFGNLVGYNEHHKFFGNSTKATPDGRCNGDMINFGLGQYEGKDKQGLTALLNSVAKCDPKCVMTGPSVTNVMIEEELIKNDDSFEKLVSLFESYFLNGGTHFQLTYVSKKDLVDAKINPEKHKNLRVRVSGFSDYFVFLNEGLQDEIIKRTVQH